MPSKHRSSAELGKPELADVLVIGSGPIGATFARQLVDAGRKVLMIDVGEQATRRIGDHKKNSVAVQKDISLFTNSVRGELSLLSVPIDKQVDAYVEPVSWEAKPEQFIHNGQNPDQLSWDNLPTAAATRVVGGMGSHWTCCTPRQLPGLERSTLFSDSEWDELYHKAETLFRTNRTTFDKSIRHQLVKNVLLDAYKSTGREFSSMPLACDRNKPNREYVEWTCPATILGDLAEPNNDNELFELRANTQCTKLQLDTATGQVAWAVVSDLLNDKTYAIKAKKYVVCAGAVLTPGILVNSGLDAQLPALGRYMTEQTMAFCQVLLKRSIVDNVVNDPYRLGWTALVKKHQQDHPNDPLPFPFNDPDPQVYTPLSKSHPWHTQIHRDAFGYGEVATSIDQRLVVDLRFFGYIKPIRENWVEYKKDMTDGFGMPQPSFHFRIPEEDAERTHAMMSDMVQVASHLGGFLPGAEPKYLVPGSALHICGTYRAGERSSSDMERGYRERNDKSSYDDNGSPHHSHGHGHGNSQSAPNAIPKDSVVDKCSRVWGQRDLYLGGCGVIPTQSGCNPTLTAACFAIYAAGHLVQSLERGE